MHVAIILVALLLVSTSTHAGSDRDNSAASNARTSANIEPLEKPNKRSCRKVKVTGSHIRQRVCMTNASWRELEEQQELERVKARALSANPTNAVN